MLQEPSLGKKKARKEMAAPTEVSHLWAGNCSIHTLDKLGSFFLNSEMHNL